MRKENLPSDRALSVRQPYAQLLVTPGVDKSIPRKWCENRTWKPGKLPISKLPEDEGCPRLLIHASAEVDREAMGELMLSSPGKTSAIIGSVRLIMVVDVQKILKGYMLSGFEFDFEDIAVNKYRLKLAMLLDYRLPSEKHFEYGRQFVDVSEYDESYYWWFFDRPIPLREPIPCKGKLNIWKYDVS